MAKKFSSLAAIKRQLPAATAAAPAKASRGKGEGSQLMITVPAPLMVALRTKAAATGGTVRAIVLGALRDAGYPVPASELRDRRRNG
jgi:hypothetical protein